MTGPASAGVVRTVGRCLPGLLAGLALACGGSVEGPAETATASGQAAPPPAPASQLPLPPPPVAPALPTPEQLAVLQARVDEAPADATARRRLAIALFAARRHEDGLEQFEKLAAAGNDPVALVDLANAYALVSRTDEAIAANRRALALAPGHAAAHMNLGDIASLKGDFGAGVDHYRRALVAQPGNARAQYQLARALELQGDYRGAYTTYAAVLEGEPATPEELVAYDDALYRMAALDMTMGAHERAEDMLVALLEANPNHASAHYAYAQLLLLGGRLPEAQSQLEAHMATRAATAVTSQVATGD